MSRVLETVYVNGQVYGYLHRCYCGLPHVFTTQVVPGGTSEPRWRLLNGNLKAPTFDPSMRAGDCHYRITSGRINYEPDSRTRPGESLPMIEIPEVFSCQHCQREQKAGDGGITADEARMIGWHLSATESLCPFCAES